MAPCDLPLRTLLYRYFFYGWLFRDGDSDHLVEKILAAMNQREKLPEIGRASRGEAEKRADWKKNAEALMQVYRSLGKNG